MVMTRVTGRRILGLFWLIDGILELLPGTAGSFLSIVKQMAQGQPPPIHHLVLWGYNVMLPYPIAWNDALGAAEIAVGVALLIGLWPRLTLAASILLTIPLWIWGQAFGGFLTGSATDIGAMPLYALAALLVWPRSGAVADRKLDRRGEDRPPSPAPGSRNSQSAPGVAQRSSRAVPAHGAWRRLTHDSHTG